MTEQHTDCFTRYENIPEGLESYKKNGGFSALKRALALTPEKVIDEVENARLLGRGGAGFPTGKKWKSIQKKREVYLVCNADEGEPGTFKDRYIMTHAPYLLLEGMMIAAYAIGAGKSFIYIRGEYPEVQKKLEDALEEVRQEDLPCSIEIKKGGGSYVVGDETALLHSLMGYRGTPWKKPPYPTEKGLWDKPTIINNVETLACIPLILKKGSNWFRSIGEAESPGPKLYCISGHVCSPGVYERPMGTSVEELINAAGGVKGNLKAVQIGGTAGAVYDRSALPYHLDYAFMQKQGGILGSGALVVMNTSVSMMEVLEVEMRFFAEESCGKCFPCRYGTRQLTLMADYLALGKGRENYLELLQETAEIMKAASFCPFGKSAILPVKTILETFGDEIRSQIRQQQFMREAVQ